MIRLATAQTLITSSIRKNGQHVRAALRQAAACRARLVHLPEAALSGYVDAQFRSWADVDWDALDDELAETAAAAAELGVWVVVGCNHRLPAPWWPQNSLYVISNRGVVTGRYSKRFCSNTEVTYWYTPGTAPQVFDVDGIRFGCAMCIEVSFPTLFAEYERMGVHCVLLSSYSSDAAHGIMARAHAATNCFWVSLSTPAACSRTLPSCLIGPDGVPIGACAPETASITVQDIDPDAPRFQGHLHLARPWRARALSGEIYVGRIPNSSSHAA